MKEVDKMLTNKHTKNPFKVSYLDVLALTYKECDVFPLPLKEELYDSKFTLIDKKIDEFVSDCTKVPDEKTGFQYRYETDQKTERDLKEFLTNNKDFVFKYISSQQTFVGSHIYQLYLQYVPHILTDPERSLFLDAYINMCIDLKAPSQENLAEKRQILENTLRINHGL